MPITFRCPNGHRLTCPEERAGQTGKCPKCGTQFQVPLAHEAPQPQMAGVAEGSAAGEAAASGSGVGLGTASTGSGSSASGIREVGSSTHLPTADTIVFLCPNGHKLNAPARLQGKPGKCPHCSERFLVPMMDDEPSRIGNQDFLDMLHQQVAHENHSHEEQAAPTPQDSGFNFGGFAPQDDFTASLMNSGGTQAMADLFTSLWEQRGQTGIVELYLKGGEILSPHWYAPQLSHQDFGMFAFQEQDGSHTLTAVQWSAVERVALRGMPSLPPGIFDG